MLDGNRIVFTYGEESTAVGTISSIPEVYMTTSVSSAEQRWMRTPSSTQTWIYQVDASDPARSISYSKQWSDPYRILKDTINDDDEDSLGCEAFVDESFYSFLDTFAVKVGDRYDKC